MPTIGLTFLSVDDRLCVPGQTIWRNVPVRANPPACSRCDNLMMRQLRNSDICSVSKIESELLSIYPEPRDLPTQRFAQLASQTIFGNAKLRLGKIMTSAPSNADLRDFLCKAIVAASRLEDALWPSVPHLSAAKRTEGPNQNRRSKTSNFSFTATHS